MDLLGSGDPFYHMNRGQWPYPSRKLNPHTIYAYPTRSNEFPKEKKTRFGAQEVETGRFQVTVDILPKPA